MLAEPLLVVARVAAALETLGVRYVVGGSLASSLYGVPRSTQDVDLVAELLDEHVVPFVCTSSSGIASATRSPSDSGETCSAF